jgi:heptosyltransferase-2
LTEPLAVPEWKEKRHEVYYYLNLVAEVERRFLGRSTVGTSEPDISLSISEARQQSARQWLADSGVDLLKPIVAVGAGSTNSMAKRWGTQNFAEVAERLHIELDIQVFLVGTASEADDSADIMRSVSFPIVDLTGRTSVAEAAAILSVADLLVSNDMGLAHVAPAVGTRTAVIFGPTNPLTTRPFSDQAVVIRHEVECSPCMLRDCPIDHRCMSGVTVERVLNVCRTLLSEPLQPE